MTRFICDIFMLTARGNAFVKATESRRVDILQTITQLVGAAVGPPLRRFVGALLRAAVFRTRWRNPLSVTTFPATRPWHERGDWKAETERRGLSERERTLIDAYRRDGFVVVEDARILDEIDAGGIWTRLAAHFAADGSGRVQDAWTEDAAVRAIATHPAVLDLLRALVASRFHSRR